MGGWTSRQQDAAEQHDPETALSYKFPPKSGRYFGSHFIMGGEKFETPLPEAFLFGDSGDLNFLGGRPAQCAYAPAAPGEPSRPLRSLLHVRRDSLRLVRQPQLQPQTAENTTPGGHRFSVEFTLDADVRCDVSVHYFCAEEVTRAGLVYRSRQPALSSPVVRFPPGAGQVFRRPEHTLRPARHAEHELSFSAETELYPLVVLCRTVEGDLPRQTHVTTGSIEPAADGGYALKPLKQKQCLDGLVFLLQEIYGIENKPAESRSDDETGDSGAECVICMSEQRDTLILPCRHLCVCSGCADHLRYQASNCPICRAPFRALLHLRAVQPCGAGQPVPVPPEPPQPATAPLPAGYAAIPLVEALNGPSSACGSPPSPPPARAPSTNSGDEADAEGEAPRGRLAASRSRTPSREKSAPHDVAERRSLLESTESPAEQADDQSRLVTVIPIEPEPTELDSIEELCRPAPPGELAGVSPTIRAGVP